MMQTEVNNIYETTNVKGDKAMENTTNNQVRVNRTVAGELTYSHEVMGERFYDMNVAIKKIGHRGYGKGAGIGTIVGCKRKSYR